MTTNKNINYQQIYEDELSDSLKTSLGRSDRFFELSHQERMLVEELVDIGYRRATEDALDQEVREDTAALAGDMGTQLYQFANMLQVYLDSRPTDGD